MKLSWYGHSCFSLESGGFKIVLDPFERVPGLKDINLSADAVYCSHSHFDHAYLSGLRLSGREGSPFKVTELKSFHDSAGGALRGENTIRRFEAEGISVVHLGDLGHMLSPEQGAMIKGADVLLIPVGGVYTINPQEAGALARSLEPGLIIPMHYRDADMGFPELCSLSEFLRLYPEDMLYRAPSSELQLDGSLKNKVCILKKP